MGIGMVDTFTQPSLGYMELVPDRTAQTLLPIIQAHTQSGTTVWSDACVSTLALAAT